VEIEGRPTEVVAGELDEKKTVQDANPGDSTAMHRNAEQHPIDRRHM